MQQLIDKRRNLDILNYSARMLDDELLGVQHESAERQALFLLRVLQQKNDELSEVLQLPSVKELYAPLEPVVGSLIQLCKSYIVTSPSLNSQSQAALATPLAGSDDSVELRKRAELCFEDLSEESQRILSSVGIVHDSRVTVDAVIHRLFHSMTSHSPPNPQRSASISVDRSARTEKIKDQEIEILRRKLAEKTEQLDNERQQFTRSRFGIASTELRTINDAPMSFEVERQYQRELLRSKMKIDELTTAYQRLYRDGESGRDLIVRLENKVREQESTLQQMQQKISYLEDSKKESEELFIGVSMTRDEEARMCNAAVQQLEVKAKKLSEELDESRARTFYLQENMKLLLNDFITIDGALAAASEQFKNLRTEFDNYKSVINLDLATKLETTQRQLLEVWRIADVHEADKTILKQQLNDAMVAVRMLKEESRLMLEKMRSSTEWKLLIVRAPDEAKQLNVRLQALQTDREMKRENGTHGP
jgi:hypothetical protein